MRSSGNVLIACLAVLVLGPVLALANGFYTPAMGPRAAAMGGAFVGLADDYSAVYWNPAGITQIKGMEATVAGHDVVSLASREGFVRYYGYGGAADQFAFGRVAATSQTSNRIAPGVFFFMDAGPLRSVFDKVGVAAYTLSEYGSTWDGANVLDYPDLIDHQYSPRRVIFLYEPQDYESRVKSYAISPVVAKEIVPGLSVGASVNFVYGHLELSDVLMGAYVDTIELTDPQVYDLYLLPTQMTDDVTGWGVGATFGVLYRASSQVSAGLAVRTPTTVSYDGTFSIKQESVWVGSGELKRSSNFKLTYPMWAGAGVAYRDFFFDGLTLTGDVHWTGWSSIDKIERSIDWGGGWTEEDLAQLPLLETTELNWEDTIEVGVGFDYRLGRSLSLNLGYRNSPTPAPDETYSFMMPQTAKNVIAMGATYRQDFWRAAFALAYHAGDERTITTVYNMNGKHVEDIMVPSLSFTYAF